ncbi:MAG: AAA family ATPase [Campylobacteraceae bacterium]|nr:AAA family ATPase [Campylobacteraceae bacterium]
MIARFKIIGLFGFRNVDISFEDNVKILIGENGFGKTTVLNSLYYLLNKKYRKLSNIEFETMELIFENEEKIQFSKFELENYLTYKENNNNHRRLPMSFLNQIENLDFSGLDKFTNFNDEVLNIIDKLIQKEEIKKFAPLRIMAQEIFRYIKEQPISDVFDKLEQIRQDLNFSILYLPTYRRVEEDLKNLGTFKERIVQRSDRTYYREMEEDFEVTDDTLIHFGMEDVKQKIIKIEQEIEKSTITGFSKLTGQMLSHFLHTAKNISSKEIEALDQNTIKIILHRVGDNIPKRDKESILSLLKDTSKLKAKKD